ncbi:MAG: hypothetical protein ACRDRY_22280 [Pseudonocardiaceae bacterium]
MNEYPRTWVIRQGPDTGRVLIQWGPRMPLTLVSPSGEVSQRYRFPPGALVRGDGD